MPKFTKDGLTVEAETPTEIVTLRGSGFVEEVKATRATTPKAEETKAK